MAENANILAILSGQKCEKVVKIDLFLVIFGKIFGKKIGLPKQANFWYQYRYQKCTKLFGLFFARGGTFSRKCTKVQNCYRIAWP